MIIDKFAKVKGHPKNIKYFSSKGYDIKLKEFIFVNIVDLSKGSTVIISCSCDNCLSEKKMLFKEYYSYTKGLTTEYYCNVCNKIKYKQTCLLKYGTENSMSSKQSKEKLKNSLLKKYGVDHYSKTDEYKKKYRETCIRKYGVDNASKSQYIKDLISNINFKKFNSIDKFKKLVGDEYIIREYLKNRNFKIYHNNCNSEFEIFTVTLSDRIRNKNIVCVNCNPIDQLSSSREIELKNFLNENNIKFLENSYKIIPPLSLDIYLPDYNLAIEFNGVYWHSEIYKDKNYHINKTNLCNRIGIDLMHIWEDDWKYQNDIIKSIILNRLNLLNNKIFARNCEIKEVNDTSLVKKFLNENHIQGYSHSKIKIGLFYNEELVSLMIFGKNRKDMELIRFCNKIGTSVIGSASRLFSFFIKNYNFNKIVSFSDISIFNGKIYEVLGFNFESQTNPNYWWVIGDIRKHRFNYNKKELIKQGFDSNKTEVEIMHERGYYRVWGCGQKKWIYNLLPETSSTH